MRFKYIGDDNDPPEQIVFMGRVEFRLGQIVDVTDDHLVRKLRGNKCFQAVRGRKPKGQGDGENDC